MAFKLFKKEKDVTKEASDLWGDRAKDIICTHSPDKIIKGVDLEKRTLHMIATDETKDRDGDVIKVKGWDFDNYRKNPVFLWAHNYGSVPLAAAITISRKRTPWRIELTHKFPTEGLNPFADMILALYFEKIINAGSVGFIPTEWEKAPDQEDIPEWRAGKIFKQCELLEHSGCAVPSNPNAIQDALKGKGFSPAMKDVILGNQDLELEPKVVESIQAEFHEIREKGIEIEETTSVSVQVPEKIEKTEGDETPPEEEDGLPEERMVIKLETIRLLDEELAEAVMELVDQESVKENSVMLDVPVKIKPKTESSTPDSFKTLLLEKAEQLSDEDFEGWLVSQKIGAVLNAKNKQLLLKASAFIKEVLDAANADDVSEEETSHGDQGETTLKDDLGEEDVYDAIFSLKQSVGSVKAKDKVSPKDYGLLIGAVKNLNSILKTTLPN